MKRNTRSKSMKRSTGPLMETLENRQLMSAGASPEVLCPRDYGDRHSLHAALVHHAPAKLVLTGNGNRAHHGAIPTPGHQASQMGTAQSSITNTVALPPGTFPTPVASIAVYSFDRTRGPAGTLVTLTGANFLAMKPGADGTFAYSVTFSGDTTLLAKFEVVSDSLLEVTVPRGSRGGAVNVWFGHPNGTVQPISKLKLLASTSASFTMTGLPASHLPTGFAADFAHNLTNRGGKTIADLKFYNFYDSSTWSASDMQNIDAATKAAMADSNLNSVMQEYFGTTSITSTFKGSKVLDGSAIPSWTYDMVEYTVSQLYRNGYMAGQDLSSTVFNLLLPRGATLSAYDLDSRNGLGGYHHSVVVNGATIYYSAIVYSEGSNGVPVFQQSWRNVAATMYHEMQEFRTDPDVNQGRLGWYSDVLGEVGDGPEVGLRASQIIQEVALADGSGSVPIQFMWSNRLGGPAVMNP